MTEPHVPPTGSLAPAADPFFVHKDCRLLFQRRLVDVARAAGIAAPAVIEAFVAALGTGYDDIVAAAPKAGFEQANGLTSSRITLMGDDDLELEIRIGEIGRRLGDIGGTALWKAQLRFMTLLRRPHMDGEGNPVGPGAIALGLWVIGRDGGGSLESRLGLLSRFEAACREHLPVIYDEINGLLAKHGVEPMAVQPAAGVNRGGGASEIPSAGTSAAATASAEPANANALASLQNTIARLTGGAPVAPATGGGSDGGTNAALSAATLVMLNQLLARLEAMPLPAAAPEGATPRSVKAQELGLTPGGADAIAIDTLAHIFDAIFNHPQLPDPVKAAVGRLQIPLLKASIVDSSFFGNTGHPGRRLINAMGRAAVGLPAGAGRDHPVCARLAAIGAMVAESGEEKGQGFDAALSAAEALIAEQDEAADAAARPYLPLALELERRSKARAAARAWAAGHTSQGLPAVLGAFIDDLWTQLMAAAWLDGGEAGSRWQEDAATITDLLWSIAPKASIDHRKRLATLVPSLLKQLNAGLDRLAISPEDRAPFLDACFALQTAALRGNGEAPPLAPAKRPTTAADAPETTVELAGRRLRCLQTPGEGRSPYRATGSTPWQPGDWLQFRLPEGETRCGRLSWTGPGTGTALLANAEWNDAIALTPGAIEAQMRSGDARVASRESLFDRAAERALGQLAR